MARPLVGLVKTGTPPHSADSDLYIATVADYLDEHAVALDELETSGSVSPVYNVKTYGAEGDGVADDTEAIQDAIDAAAAAGGGTVWFPNGTYLVSNSDAVWAGCVQLKAFVTLLGESKGAVIKLAPNQAGSTRILTADDSASDFAVVRLTLDGSDDDQTPEEHMAGIFIGDVTEEAVLRARFSDLEIRDCCGDGIDVWAGCADILIENCYVHDNGRSGVALNGGGTHRVTIRNCQLLDNFAQQIDTEVEAPLRDIVVQNCHLRSLTDYALTVSGHESITQSDGFLIDGNVIEGGVFMVWAKNVRFTNNNSFNRPTDTAQPLYISRKCENVIVKNNVITNDSTAITGQQSTIILEGTTGDDKPTNIQIIDNVIDSGEKAEGVGMVSIHSASLVGNKIIGGAGIVSVFGIDVRCTEADGDFPVESLIIERNHIIDFVPGGIVLWGYTGDPGEKIKNLIVCNNVFEKSANTNMTHGMDLDYDNNHVVVQATVMGNVVRGGIAVAGGANNGGWPSVPVLVGGNQGDRGIYEYTGTPEGVIAEAVGALATDRSGSGGLVTYVKASGSSTTGWVPVGGASARGTITCVAKASMADTDYITIGDGFSTAKLYEFDTAGDGVTGGRVQVDISGSTSAHDVALVLKTAIEANQSLFTVTEASGVLTLVHNVAGKVGNVTITENVANAGFLVTGMTGGVNPAR